MYQWAEVHWEWYPHRFEAIGIVLSSFPYILLLTLILSPVSYVAPVRDGILIGVVVGTHLLNEGNVLHRCS